MRRRRKWGTRRRRRKKKTKNKEENEEERGRIYPSTSQFFTSPTLTISCIVDFSLLTDRILGGLSYSLSRLRKEENDDERNEGREKYEQDDEREKKEVRGSGARGKKE